MITLIILASIVVTISAQCNYTSICSDHTICTYPTVGPSCTNLKFSGVNQASDRQAAVDEHNRVRRIVANGEETRGNPGPQPSAANMNELQWDTELATIAQRWANQCTRGHDSCRNVERFYVGQNMYMKYTSGNAESDTQDWKGVVQAWYSEVPKFNRNNINPFTVSPGAGHYTQVVWAETKYIGCGFAAWRDGLYKKVYVCNYGPGGNMIGDKMYATGSACSQCPNGCKNSLCQ